MTTGEIPTPLPWRTATDSDQPTAARHRDPQRPPRYGPHFRRRAANARRAIDRYFTGTKETQR